MDKDRVVVRLNQALQIWEEICFLHKTLSQNYTKQQFLVKGPLISYKTFRKHVLSCYDNDFDSKRFIHSGGLMGKFNYFPAGLFAWNKHSRRVFELDPTLQTLLSATTLETVQWKELHWPFDSFAINLDSPITDENNHEFDCILVSRVDQCIPELKNGGRVLLFHLLSSKMDLHKQMSNADKYVFNKSGKNASKRQLNLVAQATDAIVGSDDYLRYFMLNIDAHEDALILDSLRNGMEKRLLEEKERRARAAENQTLSSLMELTSMFYPEHVRDFNGEDEYAHYSVHEKAIHVVASLCMFLSTLPPKKFPSMESHKTDGRMVLLENQNLITNETNVCVVTSKHVLSRESQATAKEIEDGRINRSKKIHWRRGHWRKMQNYRVWIKPTLVNSHKLLPLSLPSGSRAIVT